MNKRTIVLVAVIVVVAAVLYFGGHTLWHLLVALHHQHGQ